MTIRNKIIRLPNNILLGLLLVEMGSSWFHMKVATKRVTQCEKHNKSRITLDISITKSSGIKVGLFIYLWMTHALSPTYVKPLLDSF